MVLLLGVPTLVLLLRAFNGQFLSTLLTPTVLMALRLSLQTTTISLLITLLFGTPLAYVLARYKFRGQRWLDTLIGLPLVLPPVVAGLGLLLVFGRRGLVGQWFADAGINLAFTSTAVVLAQVFVASPLFIRAMKTGFSETPKQVEAAALTLGASRWRTFWRISLPLTTPYLIEGSVLVWTRALGEFGATIVFAGNFQGRTQTMPLAIYAALESNIDASLTLSAILTVTAFLLLLGFRYITSVRLN